MSLLIRNLEEEASPIELTKKFVQELLEKSPAEEQIKILALACEYGTWEKAIQENLDNKTEKVKLIGLDIEKEPLKKAKEVMPIVVVDALGKEELFLPFTGLR